MFDSTGTLVIVMVVFFGAIILAILSHVGRDDTKRRREDETDGRT